MGDIRRLFQEQQAQVQIFVRNPSPLSPALFTARAKAIELLLLLGVTGEYLLKAVLLEHGFILNEEVRGMATKRFPQNILNMISQLGNRPNQQQLDAVYNAASSYLGQVSGKTIGFAECIKMFHVNVIGSFRTYFSNLLQKRYIVTNQETIDFFGKIIDKTNALVKIKKIRHNYAHLPDRMYEETSLINFLYNFLVFIAKTEFPADMTSLQTI